MVDPVRQLSSVPQLYIATYGLLVDYVRLKSETLPESCAYFNAPLWDPAIPGTIIEKQFASQCHLGRCGGGGWKEATCS